MLQVLYYFLLYRIDVACLALVVAGGCIGIEHYVLRKRGPQYRIPRGSFVVVGLILVTGAILAEWAASHQKKSLEKTFSGFGPTYAGELALRGHEQVTLDTPADDPHYLTLIEMEKRWLKANPIIADVYTFRQDPEGRLRLVVDSETDYNHDGEISGEKEQRTAIGEVYEGGTPKFFRALEGETLFESNFMVDRWGIWVSSFAPIRGKNGKVEAAVGIDYPAENWLTEVGSVRLVCLGTALVLIIILLTSSTFISFLSAEIEERKRALERLEQARESAMDSSAAKSEFLAITSHEVRTPLTAMLGFTSILSDTSLDTTQRRYLETMSHAGERLMELLNGILDYTHLESGKLELERKPWSPAVLIHEVIETMSARAALGGVTQYFENQLPSNLTLSGDANRVRQILLNLVGNAVKFTPSGGRVTVGADWSPAKDNVLGGRMVVRVVDTGRGIPPEKIPHLFRAFSSVDSSTTRTQGGSGLGLAISQRLVDMMGGTLTVLSTVGEGSEFTVALDCSVLPSAPAKPAPCGRSATPATTSLLRGLVIDDERLNRELLKVILRRCGIDSDLASSGAEGVALAAKNSYAIIFTDLEMPGTDGFTTAERIRAAESPGQRVPIIAISALTAKGTRERCIAAGMDDFLSKPVYLPALQSTLAALLPAIDANAKPAAAPASVLAT